MIAFRPEPQTRLIVVALVVTGEPAAEGRLACRRLAGTGLEHLAHEDFVDRGVGRQPAALDCRADGDATELDCRHIGQRAAELADRRPRRAHEVDAAVAAVVESCQSSWLLLCCVVQVRSGHGPDGPGDQVYSPPSIAITWPVM